MASDKFTRTGLNEGDVYYGTTANSAKSRESLEDNIDDKMMAYIGSDAVGGNISGSVTETKIGEVIIPANSARNRFIIIAQVRFTNAAIAGSTGTFKIRTGTSATATSNTQRQSITLEQTNTSGNSGTVGSVMIASIITSDDAFGGQIYVHITGTNQVSNANITSYCDSLLVLGI